MFNSVGCFFIAEELNLVLKKKKHFNLIFLAKYFEKVFTFCYF